MVRGSRASSMVRGSRASSSFESAALPIHSFLRSFNTHLPNDSDEPGMGLAAPADD